MEKKNWEVYITAFYWIWEIFSTVGYGDFYGSTPTEYITTMFFELLGLLFFSLLMGLVEGYYTQRSCDFEAQFQKKLDYLIIWSNKIEKSKKNSYIFPTLY